MKNQIMFVAFAIAIIGTSLSIQAQTDLTMREALYFTGSNGSTIDLKNDKYVAKGATLNVSGATAKSCAQNTCEFNVGFIGFRSGNMAAALSSYGLISVEGSGLVGNTVYFAESEATKQGVLPVKLKLGTNKITFTIDPYKKTAETNERNNTFSVTVIVNGRRPNAGNQ
jgi:hypothetical protein